MSQETNETKDKKGGKKGGLKKLVIALVAVIAVIGLVVAVSTVVSAVYLREAGGREQEVTTPQDANPLYKMYGPLDFTVNLLDKDQRRYLKAMITLGYEDKALGKELEQRKAQIRDTLINVLRDQTVEDVLDTTGTDKLRLVMINELNAVLSRGEIKDIYFTDFLIQ